MIRSYKFSNYKDGKIVPRSEVMEGLEHNPNMVRNTIMKINNYNKIHGIDKGYETIPCGYCYACKLNKSAEWATRCILESYKYSHNWFITLTYDNDHLPPDGTLAPEDMTRLIHTIREYYRIKKGIKRISYLYCGEYGTNTGRPHYHLLLFGAPFDLDQFYDTFVDTNYKTHWKSKELDKWWGKGMCDICVLEWSNAAYVARYTMKKAFAEPNSQDKYEAIGKIPEFIRMSRRPGIGMDYYDEHWQEIYELDQMVMKTIKGNTGNFKPPKAFDRKLEKLNPDLYNYIKENRKKCAERGYKNDILLTDYTDYEQLTHKAENVILKANMLPRDID